MRKYIRSLEETYDEQLHSSKFIAPIEDVNNPDAHELHSAIFAFLGLFSEYDFQLLAANKLMEGQYNCDFRWYDKYSGKNFEGMVDIYTYTFWKSGFKIVLRYERGWYCRNFWDSLFGRRFAISEYSIRMYYNDGTSVCKSDLSLQKVLDIMDGLRTYILEELERIKKDHKDQIRNL